MVINRTAAITARRRRTTQVTCLAIGFGFGLGILEMIPLLSHPRNPDTRSTSRAIADRRGDALVGAAAAEHGGSAWGSRWNAAKTGLPSDLAER